MKNYNIKLGIEKSGFTPDQLAAYVEMSTTNFHKIYKRDSSESRHLVKIVERLNLPLGYFLNDDTIAPILQSSSGKQVQQASQVGLNHPSINVGMSAADCIQKLEACEREKALLEKAVADKDMIIELLKGKR